MGFGGALKRTLKRSTSTLTRVASGTVAGQVVAPRVPVRTIKSIGLKRIGSVTLPGLVRRGVVQGSGSFVARPALPRQVFQPEPPRAPAGFEKPIYDAPVRGNKPLPVTEVVSQRAFNMDTLQAKTGTPPPGDSKSDGNGKAFALGAGILAIVQLLG